MTRDDVCTRCGTDGESRGVTYSVYFHAALCERCYGEARARLVATHTGVFDLAGEHLQEGLPL